MKTDYHPDYETVLCGSAEAGRLVVISRKCSLNGGILSAR